MQELHLKVTGFGDALKIFVKSDERRLVAQRDARDQQIERGDVDPLPSAALTKFGRYSPKIGWRGKHREGFELANELLLFRRRRMAQHFEHDRLGEMCRRIQDVRRDELFEP